jgi:hypothetical protein
LAVVVGGRRSQLVASVTLSKLVERAGEREATRGRRGLTDGSGRGLLLSRGVVRGSPGERVD